jgi:outer membrane lipoprotein carrier protein
MWDKRGITLRNKETMSNKIKAALLAAGLMAATLAHATALDQFKSFVSSTKAAKGEFSQRVVSTNGAPVTGAKAKQSSGTFVFSRPGQFIWSYQKPYEQTLQSDGTELYIYDKDLNQVTKKKLGNSLGSSPAAILFGSNDLEKNFTLKEDGSKDGLEWLVATPKEKETTFDHIRIGLRNGEPEAMDLIDSFGQTSSLTFTKFERNPAVPADQFKFVVPKGADVLQQ